MVAQDRFMQPFEAVAPSRQVSGRPARAAVLLATVVLAAVALVAMSSSGDRAELLCFVHPKTLIEIAMVLSKNTGSFPSNSHVSATFSILLRFGEFCNPTNCEKFNDDGS